MRTGAGGAGRGGGESRFSREDMKEGPSRFGTFAGLDCWLGVLLLGVAAAAGRESTSMRIGLASVVCWGWCDAEPLERAEGCSGSATSCVAAILRFRWMGGALGSLGFRGFRTFGASATGVPSGLTFGLTVLPGFRPGFFLGRPAAVSGTSGGGGCAGATTPNRGPDAVSTTISSISMLALPTLRREGEEGLLMELAGGDEREVGEELIAPRPCNAICAFQGLGSRLQLGK